MTLKREEIILVAVKLFEKKGYAATSVQDIANELGFTKAALYYYIESKEEILWAIFDRTMSTAEKRMQELMKKKMDPVSRLKQIIVNHVRNNQDEIPYMRIFFSEKSQLPPDKLKKITERERRYVDIIAAVIREGAAQGKLKPIAPAIVSHGILGMCNWMYHWFNPAGDLKPEQVAEIYINIMMSGLCKE
ncbi:MAG: TetR/AcrR family transcriptional regulator [Firmicutes bacterium]|nr:TetR/AcrR family transcriptional regulator [Bacillota bacterium]